MNEEPIVLEIKNIKGLHARAAAKFVETVESFEAGAVVSYDGMVVSGDSIMGLMMLGVAKGSNFEISTNGEQSDALAEALKSLVDRKFEEEEFEPK